MRRGRSCTAPKSSGRRRAEVAHVVHQDVDARISNGQCGFRHLSHYMAVADIADHDRAQPARFDDRVACALGSICIDVGSTTRACRSEAPTDAAADAQRPSRHHGDVVGEQRGCHADSVFRFTSRPARERGHVDIEREPQPGRCEVVKHRETRGCSRHREGTWLYSFYECSIEWGNAWGTGLGGSWQRRM